MLSLRALVIDKFIDLLIAWRTRLVFDFLNVILVVKWGMGTRWVIEGYILVLFPIFFVFEGADSTGDGVVDRGISGIIGAYWSFDEGSFGGSFATLTSFLTLHIYHHLPLTEGRSTAVEKLLYVLHYYNTKINI